MTKKSADKALEGYFDDLLHEADDVSVTSGSHAAAWDKEATAHQLAPEPQAETALSAEQQLAELEEQKRERLQKLLAQQTLVELQEPETRVATKTEAVTKIEVKAADAPTDVQENPETEQTQLSDSLLAWGENGRPLWAQGAFDVLLFEVHGLSLAVPLVALGHIVPLDKKLTRLHKQSDWFLGILPSSVGDIRTINTAMFVMPERYDESFKDTAKYVITIDGLPWGLAIDSVKQPISLQPDDVKWRTERSKRPWLAGTVKSHMCALIDIPQMAKLLEDSDMPSIT